MVNGVAFHPTKNVLASCSNDSTIKLWNTDTGAELSTLSGHSHSVRSVAWSPDGTKLASGSVDETVRIWEAATGKQLWQLKVAPPGLSVASIDYSPDGSKLAAAHYKTVSIFNMETNEVLCTVRGHRYAPSLSKECFLSLG